ncbi:DNA-processing protein DprA [Proteiniclasticum sp.]|uniref:DNA-processing protein DprA n=1 Tax=Proteiniclasticum sp. TaxID=2053595 RepID=UPI002898EAAE|nr:DNA-processing protein DprA [Proteiniclasticum sp.]
MDKESYRQIDRELRLMAALHSADYRKCVRRMEDSGGSYSVEEKERIRRLIRSNRNYVVIGDENYPERLYDLQGPPLILFYDGDLLLLDRPSAGIVGSRRCSDYGRRATFEIASALARIGLVVISGGARGVDSAAHRAVLKESGKTVCVLGAGLDVVYPEENGALFEEIRQSGLLITEYPRGFGPKKWTFPMRNRIIAGLSDQIIVTEAAEKSGSLHTASFGEEINRIIHAVPHSIYSSAGRGSNQLIELGAKILYAKENLISDFLSEEMNILDYRIRDLGLMELNPDFSALEKIFGLENVELDWIKSLSDILGEGTGEYFT